MKTYPTFLIVLLVSQVTCELEILSMTMKDLTPEVHACSQAKFDVCEARFRGHVQAAAAATDIGDKQELWCDVLQSHKICMDAILNSCMPDYPILSGKIQAFLRQVVLRGCTREGKPIDNGCSEKMRTRRSTEDKTLYDLASDCLKNNSHLDDNLSNLLGLLKNLTRWLLMPEQTTPMNRVSLVSAIHCWTPSVCRSIQHLFKRLPKE